MELYESLKVVGAAMIGLFGFLASLDKMVDLWKKYKGLAALFHTPVSSTPSSVPNAETKEMPFTSVPCTISSSLMRTPVAAASAAAPEF